jgi:two-component system, LuxR family, sensor histidine kinase DctS
MLFVSAVVALLWLSSRADSDEQRATLISDMLWLEQNLRFILTHNEELLGQIRTKEADSKASFEAQARALIENQTGLRRVRWLDSRSRRELGFPTSFAAGSDRASSTLAQSVGKPVYGAPYGRDQDWWFDVYVPVFREGHIDGIVAGEYSLQRMIEESVPWWLAERYRIVVADTESRVLASRSKVTAPASADGGYQLDFDPPGHGLSLQATPYRAPPPLAGRLLSAALVFLAIVVLWSLWALRRHEQRRLAAEQALRNEHAFRMAMENSVRTGLRARDLKGRITYVNPAFCAMVGWNAEELIGRSSPMPYWVDEEIEATRALHDRILAGDGPIRGFELRFKRRNGETFPVLIHEAPLIDADGNQTGWMSSVIDISDQKRAEELARQQQERLQATSRLVAMGEMASSLAHELNQPLAAIASYNAGCLNLLAAGNADRKELEQALTKSTEQAQRAGRIIRRIYEFVRRAEPKSESCNVGQLAEEMIGLMEPDARRQGVRIHRDIQNHLPLIRGDPVLLGQAILNLMRNGIEAMRDNAPEERQLTVSVSLEEGQIHLSIADRGGGIPAESASRLFEPFFTTKVEGMGMGLNICRSVVEGHKGRLGVDPNPDGGSIFHVLLPIMRR